MIYILTKETGLSIFIYSYRIKNLNLHPPNLLSFEAKKKNNYFFIQQYNVQDYFENIRNSYYKKVIIHCFFEIILKTLVLNQKETKIFNLTLSFLKYLEKARNYKLLLPNFQKLLKNYIVLIGYPTKDLSTIHQMIDYLEKISEKEILSKHLLNEIQA
ncbi:MAG: hypothetical protein ABDH21_02990 [bacterium]